jgi:hypothetical protein
MKLFFHHNRRNRMYYVVCGMYYVQSYWFTISATYYIEISTYYIVHPIVFSYCVLLFLMC